MLSTLDCPAVSTKNAAEKSGNAFEIFSSSPELRLECSSAWLHQETWLGPEAQRSSWWDHLPCRSSSSPGEFLSPVRSRPESRWWWHVSHDAGTSPPHSQDLAQNYDNTTQAITAAAALWVKKSVGQERLQLSNKHGRFPTDFQQTAANFQYGAQNFNSAPKFLQNAGRELARRLCIFGEQKFSDKKISNKFPKAQKFREQLSPHPLHVTMPLQDGP